jgi:hypothetical protein
VNDTVNTADAGPRLMPGVVPVLITVAILVPCALLWPLSPAAAKLLIFIAIFSTSLWAALDSWRLELQEYRSQVAAHPFVLFTALLALWIVVFPVYLGTRSRIRAGQLPRTVNSGKRWLLYICIALWCLPLGVTAMAWLAARSLAELR